MFLCLYFAMIYLNRGSSYFDIGGKIVFKAKSDKIPRYRVGEGSLRHRCGQS